MRQKQITLSKDAVLWEAGDAAHDIGVVMSGRVGVRTEAGVVGVALPRMVLGESALFTAAGNVGPRTATLFAMDDETVVVAYPASEVRAAIETGDDALGREVLNTLLGQICRNLLMVISVRPQEPLVDAPLRALVEGLISDARRERHFPSWDRYMVVFSFLCNLRDLSDRLLDALGPAPQQRLQLVESAAQALAQVGEGVDILPVVEAFLEAERAKAEWWARG
jgi:CRP-like cAMP-binding protein